MDGHAIADRRVERQALFTGMASAFARRAFDDVAAGVVPEVELTLTGSSWLAGTYRGYEAFSHYVLAARLVLEPAGRPLTYLHHDDEMVIMHEFEVGGRVGGPEIPLHVSVRFAGDGRISSLVIQPKDQTLFDEAVDSFLEPRTKYEETA
jgi:ketosteroid isomerase-like protein